MAEKHVDLRSGPAEDSVEAETLAQSHMDAIATSPQRLDTKPNGYPKPELLDNIGQNSLPTSDGLKKDFDAACQVTAVNHLVEQMTASLDADDVPKDQRMSVVAEAFMKVRQIEALGFPLLSEEELTAPPREAWSATSGKWSNIIDYLFDQYESRIGRGFVRSNLKANMPAYNSLANWLRDKNNHCPQEIEPGYYDPELTTNPLIAVRSYAKQLSSVRKRNHKK